MLVREIKGLTDILHLPKQPDYVRWVPNLRGAIVPIVDLRCRFGKAPTETTPMYIVIIVQVDGRQIDLAGDCMPDIARVETFQTRLVLRPAQDGGDSSRTLQ